MRSITWLHLSDFHFRAGEQHTWNENIVLEALLGDIRERMAQDRLRPDFVAVTGDIAFSGKTAEYDLARAFFEQLLDATHLPKERLFLVPGNHDVDRSAISRGAQAIADSLTDRDATNAVLAAPADRQLLFARFGGYRAFLNDYLAGHLPFDDEAYFYVNTIDLAGQRLAILGLNSAWVAASDDDRAAGLLLGERQTRAALRLSDDADATLRIALLHHPFDWLRAFDQNDSAALLIDNCDFVLHGHLHQSAATRLSSPDGEATVLACGACYQTREYPNMVNWVRLDLTTGIGTVHLRRYSDARGGFWAPDTLTYRNAPGGTYTFRIQGLPSVPEPPAPPHPEPVSTAQPAHSPAEPSSGHLLHITIQAGSGKTWPVVAEHKPPGDDLPVRDEGLLRIDGEALRGSADAQEYGTILGQALFQGHILRAFDQAFGASAHDLRVLLYVDAEDLRTQHWERLCAPLDRGWDHLALDQRLPFSLALPSRADRRFPPIEGDKLRALVVVASPEGLDAYNLRPFDVARTVAGVQAGLDPIPPDLLAVHPGAAGPPTLEALIDRLIDGHYALLHIVCHGSFRQELDDTVLYLANEDGRVEPVPATILITRLGRLRGGSLPYFAFLATCESASPQAEGALGGLAHRLVREVGIPAVLAMTEKVSLRTAVDLGARFYERLKVHGEPDRALVEACSRLAARGDVTVPALYSRLAGRPLFQPTPTPQEPDPVPAPPSDEPDVQETLPTIHIDPDDPPYAALRELLNAAFDPDGLHRFCQERRAFRPVLRRFGPGHGLDNMIDELLEYCRTQLLWDELVAEIARVQPRQVARFADRLR